MHSLTHSLGRALAAAALLVPLADAQTSHRLTRLFDTWPFTARNPGGYGAPIASWDVPAPLYEKIGLNLRAMAVDVISDSLIEIYCGIPSYGIAVVPLVRNPTTGIWDFDLDDVERIETPGDVHDLSLRPSTHGLPKLLLVSDGPGGFRIYGQEVQ